MFHEGGPSMYGLLCCALIGNPLALVAIAGAFVAKGRGTRIGLGAASVVVGGATVLAGIVAYLYWMGVMEDALAYADAAAREALYERGRQEALHNVWLGVGGGLVPLLLGGAALLRGLMTKPDAS